MKICTYNDRIMANFFLCSTFFSKMTFSRQKCNVLIHVPSCTYGRGGPYVQLVLLLPAQPTRSTLQVHKKGGKQNFSFSHRFLQKFVRITIELRQIFFRVVLFSLKCRFRGENVTF